MARGEGGGGGGFVWVGLWEVGHGAFGLEEHFEDGMDEFEVFGGARLEADEVLGALASFLAVTEVFLPIILLGFDFLDEFADEFEASAAGEVEHSVDVSVAADEDAILEGVKVDRGTVAPALDEAGHCFFGLGIRDIELVEEIEGFVGVNLLAGRRQRVVGGAFGQVGAHGCCSISLTVSGGRR